jgi:hypothetical protein
MLNVLKRLKPNFEMDLIIVKQYEVKTVARKRVIYDQVTVPALVFKRT